VAFFFLFFLHGTSIGNGQQGISYNDRVFMSGFAFRKTCIKHNVSKVRWLVGGSLYLIKKKKRKACVGYFNL
jgi:hypothetical protein